MVLRIEYHITLICKCLSSMKATVEIQVFKIKLYKHMHLDYVNLIISKIFYCQEGKKCGSMSGKLSKGATCNMIPVFIYIHQSCHFSFFTTNKLPPKINVNKCCVLPLLQFFLSFYHLSG